MAYASRHYGIIVDQGIIVIFINLRDCLKSTIKIAFKSLYSDIDFQL